MTPRRVALFFLRASPLAICFFSYVALVCGKASESFATPRHSGNGPLKCSHKNGNKIVMKERKKKQNKNRFTRH